MSLLCHRCGFRLMKFLSVQRRCVRLFRSSFQTCSVFSDGLSHGYSTKVQNYYEVLELTPKATDRQIKSAYYRLSKKYHPDRNASKESKAKFTQIAEAYETLGNKRLRRIYDADQMGHRVQESHTMSGVSPFPQYKTKRKPPTGRSPVYNFDEFYKQHYGDLRRSHQIKKETFEQYIKEREELISQRDKMVVSILLLSICVVLANFFL